MTTQPASLPRSISLQEIDMFSAPPVQKVSVVIPVYNEQESLPELIRRTTAACDTMGKAYEILLVDDGSSDNLLRCSPMPLRLKAATSLPCCLTVTTVSTPPLWLALAM
jgi:hypothetical protein